MTTSAENQKKLINILLVDPRYDRLMPVVADTAGQYRYTLHCTESAGNAVSVYYKYCPHILLGNGKLPGMGDCIQFYKERFPFSCIIALNRFANKEAMIHYLDRGAWDYVIVDENGNHALRQSLSQALCRIERFHHYLAGQ